MAATVALFLLSTILLAQSSLGEIICEELPTEKCSFSIAQSGKRCVLEKYSHGEDALYQCRSSDSVVEKMANHIESDKCVESCGVDRKSVGISSDSLLEPNFAAKLCSPECYNECPNIVDLYFNLAAGEGAFLPALCEAQRANPRRTMVELLSSGVEAASPATFESFQEELAQAPAPGLV